jgi:hypothetical protein
VYSADSFLDRVYFPDDDDPNGCWIWAGSIDKDGYGRVGSKIAAHRYSYALFRGSCRGLLVCHHCDTRSCVRPSHLFVGTIQDNVADCIRKGRQVKGEDVPTHKLTADEVRVMRKLAARGVARRALASLFGVRPDTVKTIVLRKSWRHI